MSRFASRCAHRALLLAPLALIATGLLVAQIPTTLSDFRVPGTQVGDVSPNVMYSYEYCRMCHGDYDFANEPGSTWNGSLMANAGRDPLFYAQMALANQDANYVGYYCLRCHVPQAIVSGHAEQADGSTLDRFDRRGVDCHFCHSMVDPIYIEGTSPPQDAAILAGLDEVPEFFGNAMFVLDPTATRRGPYADPVAPHEFIESSFFRRSDLCGTCHDVGNVATIRQPDGSFRYNALDTPAPDSDPWAQFPLERTYTEWKLSAFASDGVDMAGRFGGVGDPVMRTCQDCHMPKAVAQGCFFGPERPDLHRHDFAGAAAPILDLVMEVYGDDNDVDPDAVAAGRAKAVSMLERAASLELTQECGSLRSRVINETGHKLPTGHIEGRRVWVNARFYDAAGALLREYGHYDTAEAELDETSTRVYEMKVGLSSEAAAITGLPAGETTHMALADTIWKDNRIPPRGFNNARYEAGGAPAVEHYYADGEYWDDVNFAVPAGAASADVTVYYQNLPRSYIDHLREANHSDHWGETLHAAWTATGRGAPIAMTTARLDSLSTFVAGDLDCDCAVGIGDLEILLMTFGLGSDSPAHLGRADLDGDLEVSLADLAILLSHFAEDCP
ncbi:MAG: hypothetical protein AMXMBFR47_17430 [Planctomycetota bacterium]